MAHFKPTEKIRRQAWWIAFAFIVGWALFTRFVHLGGVPNGMSWDEAAIGYVGKMVVTTGRDEHGALLPRTFMSFGDYKAPLAIYITGVFSTLFGLSPFVTRLPFALAGVGTILLTIDISRRLTNNKWMGLLGGWLLVTLPWHTLFSRVAFESGMALFFMATLIWSWLGWRESRDRRQSLFFAVIASLSSVAALYTYHSARIVIPLALALLTIHEITQRKNWLKDLRNFGIWLAGTGILTLPLIYSVLYEGGASRAAQTTIFTRGLASTEILTHLLKNFFIHLSPQFLYMGLTDTFRHSTALYGVLTWSHGLLFLSSLALIIFNAWQKKKNKISTSTTPWLFPVLFLMSLVPAIIGFEVPHANRALLASLPLLLITIEGINILRQKVKEQTFALLFGSTLLFLTLEFSGFWWHYLHSYPRYSGKDWLQGHEQMIHLVQEYREKNIPVLVSDKYGQPAMFFAYWLDIDPQTYRTQQIPGVKFGEVSQLDVNPGAVIVLTENESLNIPPHYEVFRSDGTVAFRFYEIP